MRVATQKLIMVALSCAAFSCAPPPDPIALDNYTTAYIAAYCATSVRCLQMSDQAFCESLYTELTGAVSFDSVGAAVAAVQAGKATYDSDAAGTCVAAIGAATCTAFSGSINDLNGCALVFTGTVADGDDCIADQECVPSSYCAQDVNAFGLETCGGICTAVASGQCRDSSQCAQGMACDPQSNQCVQPVPPGTTGNACGTGGTCASGLSCDFTQVPPVCEPSLAAGQACSSTVSCADGLLCVPDDSGSGSTCLAPVTLGEPCQALYQCGGEVSSMVCDPASMTCVPRPQTGPCAGGILCDILTSHCDLSAPGGATCEPYGTAGEPCVPMSDACGITGALTCALPSSVATTGTCSAPPGSICTP